MKIPSAVSRHPLGEQSSQQTAEAQERLRKPGSSPRRSQTYVQGWSDPIRWKAQLWPGQTENLCSQGLLKSRFLQYSVSMTKEMTWSLKYIFEGRFFFFF